MFGRVAKIARWTVLSGVFAFSLSLAGDSTGPAPDFNLNARGGKDMALSQLRGQVVMINFWASWCGPCQAEMPKLEEMYRKYKPMGFTLLGVNVDPDSTKGDAAAGKAGISFPVLFDRENRVSKLYNVSTMPSSVLIDRKGNMRFLHRGYKPGDENTYLNQIRTLVRE